MRTEREMMEMILSVAKNMENVRAVAMNGSRTNPHIKPDRMQDFDVVYLVRDMQPLVSDKTWVDCFGERVIMQTPEDMDLFPPSLDGRYTFLMQFVDGNRLDLMLVPLEQAQHYIHEDSLTRVLMDKDGLFPPLPPPDDTDYRVKRPVQKDFDDCCNEFWWLSTYVAKGLWRGEILYATSMLNIVRDMLLLMLDWYMGAQTNFTRSAGKCHKFLPQYLPGKWVQRLLATYGLPSIEQIWQALFEAYALFGEAACVVARMLDFTFDAAGGERVYAYLKWVQEIPREKSEK